MVKKALFTLLLAAAGLLAWRFGHQAALRYFFRISGTVTLSGELLTSMPGANSMLFVVARNDGGVPVAYKKIINPVFPAEFELDKASLIMPDLLTRRLYLEATVNSHGKLGEFRRGDMRGSRSGSSYFISKAQDLTLDKRAPE